MTGYRISTRCGADLAITTPYCSLIEHEGDDLRDVPLIERKQRPAKLLGKASHAIRFNEHLAAR
ncbi:hypothetical protein [Bradyrhizobium sp. AZCC 2289]|jgi:hypothetical protein|uniref:hypothetical protein n=1 Tax=Bradyrhizobium sp. AZCC 2289 TaxID=3117026 RepID=UPI002FF072C2